MFKKAHSISITLGFVVACACFLCGVDRLEIFPTQSRQEVPSQAAASAQKSTAEGIGECAFLGAYCNFNITVSKSAAKSALSNKCRRTNVLVSKAVGNGSHKIRAPVLA